MNPEELSVKITELDQITKSVRHRLDRLEALVETINRLATSVEVMATKQDVMTASINTLTLKVDTIEAKPGKRWESAVEKIVCAVIGAFIAWVIGGAA